MSLLNFIYLPILAKQPFPTRFHFAFGSSRVHGYMQTRQREDTIHSHDVTSLPKWYKIYMLHLPLLQILSSCHNTICLHIHYSKEIESQTFNIRFFSLVRTLGIWVLPGETSTSHNNQTGTPVSPDNTQNI